MEPVNASKRVPGRKTFAVSFTEEVISRGHKAFQIRLWINELKGLIGIVPDLHADQKFEAFERVIA